MNILKKVNVIAVGAHPDDVEFMMAGTLLLLGRAGACLHIWSLSDGSLGSKSMSREETARVRRMEMEKAGYLAEAKVHEPLFDDMGIIYEPQVLPEILEVVRGVKPDIMLVHGPDDYSEDHVNAGRIAVASALAAGFEKLSSSGGAPAWHGDIFVYHAMPFGLRDMFGRRVCVSHFVDVSEVFSLKREMLTCHRSQIDWLEDSQGIVSPAESMEEMCRELARESAQFELAEGWRKHNHIGLSRHDDDPLAEILGEDCEVTGTRESCD